MEKSQWSLTLEKEAFLDQQLKEKQITINEYYVQIEALFRDYLKIDPSHTISKLQVVKILRKKVIPISKLKEILNNEHLIISEKEESHCELIALYNRLINLINKQEHIYQELAELGKNPDHIENLEQFLTSKKNNTTFFEQHKRFKTKKLLPINEDCLHHLSSKDILELKNLSVEYVDKLETYLRILSQMDNSPSYNKLLAQVLFYRGLKVEENPALNVQHVYEMAEKYYKECIRLDTENETYKIKWLNLLSKADEVLSSMEQTGEIINKRIEINSTLFRYGEMNEATNSALEKLLFKKEEIIYIKQDQELIDDREYFSQMYQLYSMLVKIRPENPNYKYILARLGVDLAENILKEAKNEKGYNNNTAIQLLQSVLELNSNNIEAVLRVGIIQLYNSDEIEAYNTLTSLVEQIDQFKERDFKIEFCIAYAVSNAYINKSLEAGQWLEKARQLDENRKYGHEIASANLQIKTVNNIDICNVFHVGKEKKIAPLYEINKFITQYEEKRLLHSQLKIIFDFRDMDSPKIVGPKKTVPVGSEERVKILEYLLEDGEPKSLKQIQNSCDYLEKSSRTSIQLLRKKISESFCSNSENNEEFDAAYHKVKNEILINRNSKYEWVFTGDTYLIKAEE
ncbi:hypothetical protein [Lysinibacillus sp. BW-2-10]|uniref:hypothetical protein n=1 Tax=Lysinibacillus sp. BW-2-10 TaxID=2590030 RepID=UPI00117DCBEB|nr:hypothetical protein [Lysinibacillus sp. BW-2-10]TSI05290.1 hypothetical protein FJQ64_13380 [Lysinibacillus sp. BW-2-10]